MGIPGGILSVRVISIVIVMRDELLLAAGGYLYFIHYLENILLLTFLAPIALILLIDCLLRDRKLRWQASSICFSKASLLTASIEYQLTFMSIPLQPLGSPN